MSILLKTIYLLENQGHGNARRISLSHCKNELVALMDSDDISLRYRFEKQLSVFERNKDIDIVGGQITEFIGKPSNIIGKRMVPESDLDIKSYMKKRCPMNQVSVMFKKSFIEKVGGYIDWFCEEDYYLWIRMSEADGIFANVSDTLVNVRVGEEMSARRGGWKYFSSEAKLQGYMLKKKIISLPRYLYNIAIRFCGEVLLPNQIRTKLFRFMRKDIKEISEVEMIDKLNETVNKYPPFSVSMCVYGGDNPEWFDTALRSVIDQTVKPDEIVLVIDGPIPNGIQAVIDKYTSICNGGGVRFIVVKLERNSGHGTARRIGLENCKNEIIALMDADDISISNRFEKQLSYFMQNPVLSIVGSNIQEFIGSLENCTGKRIVPENDFEIKRYMKKRCPMNQMTVMFRKEAVQTVGGYLDWYCDEDYYLWIRLALAGKQFANLSEILVNVRIGEEMYSRRGGWKYFKSEAKLQNYMLKKGMIGLPRYTFNVAVRFVLQVLMPNKLRGIIFQKYTRSKG